MKTNNYKIGEIAENNNLEVISTTSQSNGYPSNVLNAIIGFETFAQAVELAQETVLTITCFNKKDGWGLWYRRGEAIEPFKNSSEDYGDNYNEFSKMDEYDFVKYEVKPLIEDADCFDQIEAILKTKKEIFEEIEKMENDEIVITNEGRYFETIKKESMSFYHDTKHMVIGLV